MTSRAYSLRVELPVVVAAYLLANYLCFSYPVTGFITLMVVLILFAKNVNVLTQLVSNRFQHFVTIFAVLSSMLFALAYFAGASADSLKGTMNIGHPAEPTTKPSTPWTNHYLPYMYEVCNVNYYGLHVTDLALLSEAAYMVENTTELHAVMEEDFGDTALSDYNVTSVVVENYNAFFETHFPPQHHRDLRAGHLHRHRRPDGHALLVRHWLPADPVLLRVPCAQPNAERPGAVGALHPGRRHP
ncbi:unnamed protein product, partial [Heterosigma akashiwo]